MKIVKDKPMATPAKTQPLKHFFYDRSQRWWAVAGISSVFGLVLLAQLKSLFGRTPAVQVEAPSENKHLSMYADTQHPLANLGADYDAYAAADSSEKLDLIFASLENFDHWLKPRLNTAMGDALAKEALRMQAFAQKEANSSKYDTADAISLFDFGGCVAKLPGDRCVLLRYAGEGIANYAQASAEGDVYGMSHGYLRMRAALLALGQFEIASNSKQDVPLNALANYRQAMYLALQFSPAAIAPVEVSMPDTFGATTPAEALEQAYPQNRSTESVAPEVEGK